MRSGTETPWRDRRNMGWLSGVALIGAFLVAPALRAQVPEPQPQQPPAQQVELQSGELEEFAEVFLDVQEIHAEYQPQLAQVTDPAQAQSIQQRMNQEMVVVVEESDLSVERYQQIATALSTNPVLAEEFQPILNAVLAARQEDEPSS